jgi:Ribonuclease G/E
MAEFDRKALRKIFEDAEIEVPKDVLGQICNLHTTSNEDLTESVKTLKADLEKAERERDTYKAKAPKEGEETVLKSEYDALKREYDDYKADITAKNTRTEKENAFRELLKSVGVSEKRLNAIIKVSDIDGLELDKDGKIKDADKHTETVKTEWADFIETTTTQGANTANPPANTGKGTTKTKEEIMAIKDGAVRRAEIAANPQLFGIENK